MPKEPIEALLFLLMESATPLIKCTEIPYQSSNGVVRDQKKQTKDANL